MPSVPQLRAALRVSCEFLGEAKFCVLTITWWRTTPADFQGGERPQVEGVRLRPE